MNAHTPGPWIFGRLSLSVITKEATMIANLSERDDIVESVEADGLLLAAAPDLLAACEVNETAVQSAIELLRNMTEDDWAQTVAEQLEAAGARSRAAIAKAERG